jgi:hypothetical protein
MVEYLRWATRWVSDTEEIDKDYIESFRDELEYRLMSGCCDDNLPIQYRYSSTGVLQRSLNGGGVWEDCPNYDPRVYSPVYPPMSGADDADKRCIAAVGGAALIKEQVGEQLTDDMSRYTLQQLITDWVGTMLETSNPFEALLRVITNQIFALVIATLRPALTTEVYDLLRCVLYDNMSDNASFTEEQWENARSDTLTKITGIAGIFLEHLLYLLGRVGLTNVVRQGYAIEGDCSDCNECTYISTVTYGTLVENVGCRWRVSSAAAGGVQAINLRVDAHNSDTYPNACGYWKVTHVSGGAFTAASYNLCGGEVSTVDIGASCNFAAVVSSEAEFVADLELSETPWP